MVLSGGVPQNLPVPKSNSLNAFLGRELAFFLRRLRGCEMVAAVCGEEPCLEESHPFSEARSNFSGPRKSGMGVFRPRL